MGKIRRERRYLRRNGSLPPHNNEKFVLTFRQTKTFITRVRINQMEKDDF